MWTLPDSKPQKFGAVLAALGIGVGVALLTTVVMFLVGLALSLLGTSGFLHLGELQPWLPIVGLEYGSVAGIIVGAIVAWRICRSRLRDPSVEDSRF